jgi:hypothetical protein
MPGIKIDRLEIRLSGVSPEMARASSRGLGRAVLDQLIRDRVFLNGKPGGRIDRLAPDTLKFETSAGPSALRGRISGRIVDAISTPNRRKTEREG